MTNRIPLIVNAGAAQIQEVSASDVLTVPGTLTANVVQTDNYQYANGQPFAGGGGNYGNSNVATFLADFGNNTISTTGDVTANAFVGDGSQLTNLPLATNSTVGVVALGNGFTLNSSNQVTTSSLYNTNLTQPTQHYALRVDTNGVVILPDQSIINGSTLRAVAGSYAGLTTDDGENSWMWVDSTGAYIATQYNESGNSHQWTFDNTGNLTLPGNGEISINYANGQPYGGTGSSGAAGNAGDIQINVAGGLGADSTLRYVDNGGEMTLYADYLNAPGIFTSDIYAGDGTPSNITLTTSYGNATWTFAADGSLQVPSNAFTPRPGTIASANGYPTLLAYGSGGGFGPHGGPELDWMNADDPANTFGNSTVLRNTMYINNGGLYIGMNENGVANVAIPNWQFVPDGNLQLPDNGVVWNNGGLTTLQAGNNGAQIGSNDGQSYVIANVDGTYMQTLADTTNSLWHFGTDGNLTLPKGGIVYETTIPFGNLTGNTIALKPSEGISTDQQLLIYPTVTPGSDDNHLHLTTGNLYNTELFLGNDNLYVKLANTGNVVVNSNDDTGNSAQWIFGTDGKLNVPQGGYIGAAGVKGDGTMLTGGLGQIASLTSFYADAPGIYSGCFTANPDGTLNITTYGNGTGQLGQWVFSGADLSGSGNLSLNGGEITGGVTTTLDDTIYSITLGTTTVLNINGVPFTNPARGQVTISGITSTTQANGTWYYQAVGVSNLQLYTDGTYATPVDSTAWTPYTSGDGSVYFSQVLPSANITLNSNGYLSTFTSDGQVILPGSLSVAGDISAVGNVYARNIVAEAPFEIQVYNFNADIGGRYGVDTQTNTVTATLPATPPTGGAVFFADAAGAYNINNLIIDPNGGTIMGATGNMTVSTPNQSVGLFYNGTTWRIYNAG